MTTSEDETFNKLKGYPKKIVTTDEDAWIDKRYYDLLPWNVQQELNKDGVGVLDCTNLAPSVHTEVDVKDYE